MSNLSCAIALVLLTNIGVSDLRAAQPQVRLLPHRITLANGKSFTLKLAEGFAINVAAQGLKRVRFMAQSPDGRIFVTDMYNLADNRRGVVYILDEFDQVTKRFKRVIPYMTGLRNPNSVAFYTDSKGVNWFYLALTDRLLRYRYEAGSNKPTSQPEVLATFPDYGLGYKYGGWHLTRTIAVGDNGKIYVSVGSSCNACKEKEEVRATIVEMDPDGKNTRYFARGLRNAVGLKWIDGRLFATNMGSDHLGLNRPADTMTQVRSEANYGWPYCYQTGGRVLVDEKLNPRGTKFDCRKAPAASVAFPAHSSPLGLEYFGSDSNTALRGLFLVALHGSTTKSLRRGYKVVSVSAETGNTEDFLTGFLEGGIVHGRPADVFRVGANTFLVTDEQSAQAKYSLPETGKEVTVTIRREVFAEKLRSALYIPTGARKLPFIIHRAAQRDFNPFLGMAIPVERSRPDHLADGMYLSTTCNEDTRQIDPSAAARMNKGKIFGNYRVEQQLRACSLWPQAQLRSGYRQPVVSKIPVLILSGYMDPVTPPGWIAEVVRHLPNSKQVIIRHHAHVPEGLSHLECLDKMILEFLYKGSTEAIDTSCVGQMLPPGFFIQAAKE